LYTWLYPAISRVACLNQFLAWVMSEPIKSITGLWGLIIPLMPNYQVSDENHPHCCICCWSCSHTILRDTCHVVPQISSEYQQRWVMEGRILDGVLVCMEVNPFFFFFGFGVHEASRRWMESLYVWKLIFFFFTFTFLVFRFIRQRVGEVNKPSECTWVIVLVEWGGSLQMQATYLQ